MNEYICQYVAKKVEIFPVIKDTDTYYTLVSSCGLEVSYSLSQLKRSGLGTRELVQFFCTCIRPITEYACPVFHDGLPMYLSNELEGVQKRAMRIIFPLCSYKEAFVESGLTKLSERRQELVDKLFKNVLQNEQN